VTNVKTISGWCVERGVEGSSHGLILSGIPASARGMEENREDR
jgi:hypothetical protein